jgi:hypothetical protein
MTTHMDMRTPITTHTTMSWHPTMRISKATMRTIPAIPTISSQERQQAEPTKFEVEQPTKATD